MRLPLLAAGWILIIRCLARRVGAAFGVGKLAADDEGADEPASYALRLATSGDGTATSVRLTVLRDDDVITSSGYRIGPSEVEDCLAGHPAVQIAAVVGKPDPVRTEIVKAYVMLRPGVSASETLALEIGGWVKSRLSMHEYPREVAFVDSLPLTTSGKVVRRFLRERAVAEAEAEGLVGA